MEIPGVLPSSVSASTSIGSLLKTLQPGQTLAATVSRQLPNGHVELQIGQTRISSQPPLPLATGQSLLLRVEHSTPQQIDLRILNSLQEADTLSRALRETLPRQAPVAQSLTQVFTKLLQHDQGREALPAAARDAIRQLISHVPQVRQLTQADSLRHVIERAGARLEAQLQHLSSDTAKADIARTDLKANLVRVIQILRDYTGPGPLQQSSVTTPPANVTVPQAAQNNSSISSNLLDRLLSLLTETRPATTTVPVNSSTNQNLFTSAANLLNRLPLLNHLRSNATPAAQQNAALQAPAVRTFINELLLHLESGLARIQSNQLATVPQEDGTSRPVLILDVPVNNGKNLDNIHIRINREQTGSGDELQHIWRVTLYFEQMGVIRANIAIHNNQVNTTFFSEQPQTSESFRQHLDELAESLAAAGLNIGHLQSVHVEKLKNELQNIPGSGLFQDKA